MDVTWLNDQLNTAVHMAAANGHANIITEILKYVEIKNLNKLTLLNQQNQDGNTALRKFLKIYLRLGRDQQPKGSGRTTLES